MVFLLGWPVRMSAVPYIGSGTAKGQEYTIRDICHSID